MNYIYEHSNHTINYDLLYKLRIKNIFQALMLDTITLNIGLKNSNMEKKKNDSNIIIIKTNNKSTNFNN